uniref:BTB domain-containing protein n=1 Tax=Strongyloides stercoralis TaxID=6248 RepID=A0A0K0EN21_STRER
MFGRNNRRFPNSITNQIYYEWSVATKSEFFREYDNLDLRSPFIYPPNTKNISWQLQLLSIEINSSSWFPGKNKVQLSLKAITSFQTEYSNMKVWCKIFFDKNNICSERFNTKSCVFIYLNSKEPAQIILETFTYDEMENFFNQNDYLSIEIEVGWLFSSDKMLFQEVEIHFDRNLTTIDKNYFGEFYKMYKSKDLTDFKIVCQDQEFFVHKFILASQSSVFKAMLMKTNIKEEVDNTIIIKDFTPETVSKMIEYLYSGKIITELKVDECIQLLRLAEKYYLKRLKILCEEKLSAKISIENFCTLVEEADNNNSDFLMKACVEKFRKIQNEILENDKWSEFKMTHPTLAVKVLESAFLKGK